MQISTNLHQNNECVKKTDHNQKLGQKLEREFGIATLRQGFFRSESTWEIAIALGFSTLAIAVITTRQVLSIALRDEYSRSFVYRYVSIREIVIHTIHEC